MAMRSWRWVLAMVVCWAGLTVSGVSYYVDEVNTGNVRLEIKCVNPELLNSLGFYGARCSRLVDTATGMTGMPPRKVRIVEQVEETQPEEERTGRTLQVWYRPGGEELPFARALFAALLRRRLEAATEKALTEGSVFQLVVAGLTHRYVRGRHALSGYYEPDYEIARNQFMRQEYPQATVLLTGAFQPEQRFFFELYMMHADLLVQCLEESSAKHGDALWQLLLAEQGGEDVGAAFERLTAAVRKQNETAQTYYERMVFRLSRRRRRQSGEEVIAERVQALETVPVLGIEGGSAVKRVPLEDVPSVLADYRRDTQGVARLEGRFRELRQAAPWMLRESLEAYAKAVGWLREGEEGRFRREIQEARKAFAAALEKQKRLNTVMQETEQKHIPALRRFVDYVTVMRYYRQQADAVYPRDIFSTGSKK